MGFIPPREEPAPKPAGNPFVQNFRDDRTILDRIPTGILAYRLEMPLYANAAFLQWSGYDSIMTLAAAGGLDVLFVELGEKSDAGDGQPLRVASNRGSQQSAEGRLFTAAWDGEPAHVLMLLPEPAPAQTTASADIAPRANEAETRDLKAILDAAADGVLVLDDDGRILTSNAGAESLFGRSQAMLAAANIDDLIAPESQRAALEYLAEMVGGTAPKKGCE